MDHDSDKPDDGTPVPLLLVQAIKERATLRVYQLSKQCRERYRDVAAFIDQLERISVDPDDATRELVLASLSVLARDFYPAIDVLSSYLDDYDAVRKYFAAHLIGDYFAAVNHRPGTIARAMDCLLDSIPSIVASEEYERLASTLETLSNFSIRTEKANAVLGPLLHSVDHTVRSTLCDALSQIAVPTIEIAEQLQRCAQREMIHSTQEEDVWRSLIECFIRLCPNDDLLVESLLSHTKLDNSERFDFILRSLASLGKRARPALPHLEQLLVEVNGQELWRPISRAIESIKRG